MTMHIYEQDGNKYPSVTTILKLISTNDELMKWANFMGFKHKDITKIQEETATFGTMIHSNIQGIVDPEFKDSISPNDGIEYYRLQKTIRNFMNYFKDIEYKTIFSEKTIISSKLGYAGTLDWLVEFNNGIALMDFKTSKKVRKHMLVQLGGYYNLLKESYPYDIKYAGIIIINEDECNIYPISLDKLEIYGKIFNILFEVYKSLDEASMTFDKELLTSIKKQTQ